DIRISRLTILQPLSPEIKNGTPGYSKAQIIDNVSREIYSEEIKAPWLVSKPGIDPSQVQKYNVLRFVPIVVLPKEYIKWKDRKKEGIGYHFKSLDKNEQRVREGIYVNQGGTFVP